MEEYPIERRKAVRFIISIPIRCFKVGLKEIKRAVTKDISAIGLGLITTEELPRDIPVCLSLILLDNGEEIPVEAEVVWSKNIINGNYHNGLKIKNKEIKPIPIVLRTLKSQF